MKSPDQRLDDLIKTVIPELKSIRDQSAAIRQSGDPARVNLDRALARFRLTADALVGHENSFTSIDTLRRSKDTLRLLRDFGKAAIEWSKAAKK